MFLQKLAHLACDHLGGACSHAELLERYPREAARVKQANNSVVMHIGQLRVGLSRHRALLLKVLADSCQLPCRILRGEFYLGKSPFLSPLPPLKLGWVRVDSGDLSQLR